MKSEIVINANGVQLSGNLTLPKDPLGIVVFAHGSGSSRLSPRNVFVAEQLNKSKLGTLLFDLLTEEEESDRANVFDIGLLTDRLEAAVELIEHQYPGVPIGLFGASTGAAAALLVAAQNLAVAGVVSRGGRVDLAQERLSDIRPPTLFIVGGNDDTVLEMNREAMNSMKCTVELSVVPHATHLFEEPGALEHVAALARHWFESCFIDASAAQ